MESTSKLRLLVLIAVVAATCFAGCGALKMEGYFNSDFETQMEYVGRFVFNPNTHGRMLYDIKFPVNECCVSMIMFRGDESQWPLVRAHEDEMTCHEKDHSVPGIQNSKVYFNLGKGGCFLDTDDNGEEIVHCIHHKNMFVSKMDRWFYITFMNCHYLRNVGVHVDYKIQVLNGNGTLSREFSADESSNLAVTFISAMVLSTLIIFAIIQTVQLIHERKLHTTYRIWLMSIGTQYIGVIISLVALFNFALDGYKRDASKMAAHVFTSIGNIIFTVILIMIGKGYTITRLTIRPVGVMKIWLFVFAYSAMFVSLYVLKDFADPRDVRNIYDSEAAVGLVILRFIALAWVFYGVCFTIKDFPKKRTFYSAFTIFITIWFLSEPLMILMSKYFIPLYCRAKVIDAMYLGTAIFGHVVFLCLTRPSATNRFFPFHLRTNQVDVLPFEYVSDDIESQKFEGGFYDMFMTKDEKAKKMTNQDRVPTISNTVSEKETVSTTVTYVESIELFPSSEKDNSTGPFQAARSLGRQRIYEYIESEEDNTTGSLQAATAQQHKTSAHLAVEEDNATSSVQVARTLTQQHKTSPHFELEENNTSSSVQAAKSVKQHYTFSYLEPEEDNTSGSVQAAKTQTKQQKTNAYIELEKDIFPVQEIPSVRNPQRMYPSSESESDEDLGIITLDDIADKMEAKSRLPNVETNTYTKGGRTSTNKEINTSFPVPLPTTILANEAAMVYNRRDQFPINTKNGKQARQPASRAKDAQRMNTNASLMSDTAVKSCMQDNTTQQKADQTTPVVRKKKQRAPSTIEYEQDQTVNDEQMVDQPPPIPRKKKHQAPSTVEYNTDEALSTTSHGVLKEKAAEHREKIKAMSALVKSASELSKRAALRQAEAEYEMDLLLTEGASSVDLEKKRQRRTKIQQGNRSLEEAASKEEVEKRRRMRAGEMIEENKSSDILYQDEVTSADAEKAERRRRRRAKKTLEKRQSLEIHHKEDAASAAVDRDERRKLRETQEGNRSSEMLHLEGQNLADAEKEERRRSAEKILQKRRSVEVHSQESTHSAEAEREERRKTWETPEGNMSPEMLHQEGVTSDDVQKEERRRRRRAKKMLEKRQSLEIHHQENAGSAEAGRVERRKAGEKPEGNRSSEMLHQEGTNLADADKEERRRRRRAKKILEKRRSMEVHCQEDATSAEAEREERRKAWESPEGNKSQEMLHQEGVTSEDAQKEERKRRRAKKMLEKRQSSEIHQDGAASAEIEREERQRAWETPGENTSPEILHQEGVNLADAEKEERRKRIRAKKMLERWRSPEVHHQEGMVSAEAEREERRRRRHLRKNLEARRQAELEAQII